jgi:hypothetical protein
MFDTRHGPFGLLQALLVRETLLSTLARLLREDGPRSLDMATAVAGCFYACSCIKDLHRQLLDLQVRPASAILAMDISWMDVRIDLVHQGPWHCLPPLCVLSARDCRLS